MDAPTSSRGCRSRTLTEIALARAAPVHARRARPATLEAVVVEALNFPIPLVEVEPGIFALELFHGPTLAFKDVGARVMARLMAALHRGDEPLTILAATSGDTGSAVAHAFHGVPHTRVVILYPDGRVSPTQEAQLTMFNGERSNVRAYAVAGSFDDCHRLTREAFADPELRRSVRLTSANSVNIGRLLPQMVYYFHAVAQLAQRPRPAPTIVVSHAERQLRQPDRRADGEARRAADRAVRRRDQRQRRRARVSRRPAASSRAPSVQTIANAMDVGHPSNFERMLWLYGSDRRRDAPRRHRQPVHRRRRARRRSGGSTRSAATCSIRTARSRTWG